METWFIHLFFLEKKWISFGYQSNGFTFFGPVLYVYIFHLDLFWCLFIKQTWHFSVSYLKSVFCFHIESDFHLIFKRIYLSYYENNIALEECIPTTFCGGSMYVSKILILSLVIGLNDLCIMWFISIHTLFKTCEWGICELYPALIWGFLVIWELKIFILGLVTGLNDLVGTS